MTVLARSRIRVLALPRLAPGLVLVLLAYPTARAQTMLHAVHGDTPVDWFGYSVGDAGDVNGDGHADFVVGAPLDDNTATHAGSAQVFSGIDGSVLYTFDGNSFQDWFGHSVAGAGDVNADGFDDVIVGAPFDAVPVNTEGSAWVYSGLDGSLLYSFGGDSPGDSLGHSVSGAGDVNADGFADLIVGAPWDDNNGPDSGSARVFSGIDGSVLYTFDGDSTEDKFGVSVSGAGDVNMDGFADLIVGAPFDDNNGPDSGSARVFSGADGSVLYSFDGDSAGDELGVSVSAAGDVAGDGFGDVLVGAWLDDNNGPSSGSAWIFAGADGSVLYRFDGQPGENWLGLSVARAGDVDRDGNDDVIVGGRYFIGNSPANAGRVFSGVDGSVLFTVGTPSLSGFGASVSGGGDVDGDGFNDLIVGERKSSRAYVFSGRESIGTDYCGATTNSTGKPAVISATGSTSVSHDDVLLRVIDLPTNQSGFYLTSETPAFVWPVPNSQGALCIGGAIGRYNAAVFNTGTTGTSRLQLDLANTPTPTGTTAIQAGETWNFTAWYRDQNPNATSNFTGGLSITFK